jgi:hypothetical protein
MNGLIERVMSSMLNSISNSIYNISKDTFNGIDNFINGNALTPIINYIFAISISLVITILSYQIWRQRYFKNDFSIVQRVLRKKHLIYTSFFLIFICLGHRTITELTFNFWNSFFNESQIIDVLKQSSEQNNTQTIIGAIVGIFSSASSLIIAFSQLIEVLSLQLIFALAPLILVVSFFNKDISSTFISSAMKGIISPIIQTFIMYFLINIMRPIILSNSEMSPLMKSVFVIVSVFQGFKMTEMAINMLKPGDGEPETKRTLNMIKHELQTEV